MSNFKRKGPKSTRAGCLMCKPWKAKKTREKDRKHVSEKRIDLNEREQIQEV